MTSVLLPAPTSRGTRRSGDGDAQSVNFGRGFTVLQQSVLVLHTSTLSMGLATPMSPVHQAFVDDDDFVTETDPSVKYPSTLPSIALEAEEPVP